MDVAAKFQGYLASKYASLKGEEGHTAVARETHIAELVSTALSCDAASDESQKHMLASRMNFLQVFMLAEDVREAERRYRNANRAPVVIASSPESKKRRRATATVPSL